jgi:hypothetical protein
MTFPICLVLVRKTFRGSRESCAEVPASTEVFAPLRIQCLTITLVIGLWITLRKTFRMVSCSVISGSDLMVTPYGVSLLGIKIILDLVQLGGSMQVSKISLNSLASLSDNLAIPRCLIVRLDGPGALSHLLLKRTTSI